MTRRLLLAGVVSAGLWVLAEGAVAAAFPTELREWAAPPATPRAGVSILQGNPYLLYEYPPGEFVDAGVTLRINSLGLRGPEVAPKAGPRFLTTGDSSVFGFAVDEAAVFSTVAAQQLGVEAVNGAVPGYSTFQTLNLLRMRALRTGPDLVVIGNLWSDNNFDAFVDRDVLATYALHETTLQGRILGVLSHSAVYRLLDWKLRVEDRAVAIRSTGWMTGGTPIGSRRVAIDDYAHNLDAIVRLAAASGAESMFLLLPNREDLAGDTQHHAWGIYRRVMRETAARTGAPLLELPEVMRASGHSAAELFLDDMHPSALGHRVIAEALAARLRGWATGERVMAAASGGPIPDYEDTFGQITATAAVAEGGHVRGTVRYAVGRGAVVLDVVVPGQDPPRALASARLESPGPFDLPVGTAEEVHLRAFLDTDGDGLDPGDPRVELADAAVRADSTVVVDLDARRVTPEG